MIVGVGIDLVDLDRMAGLVSRFGERFLRRIFTEEELAYCLRQPKSTPHLAARFAAKEAAFKAIRKKAGDGIGWQQVWLVGEGGPPALGWRKKFGERLHDLGGQHVWVSISHSARFAVAQVILVSASPEPNPLKTTPS